MGERLKTVGSKGCARSDASRGPGAHTTLFLAELLFSWCGDKTKNNCNRCHLLKTYYATGTVSLSFRYGHNNHFQTWKIRLREVKQLAQYHTGSYMAELRLQPNAYSNPIPIICRSFSGVYSYNASHLYTAPILYCYF